MCARKRERGRERHIPRDMQSVCVPIYDLSFNHVTFGCAAMRLKNSHHPATSNGMYMSL